MARGWERWSTRPDGLFSYVNGEALVRVPPVERLHQTDRQAGRQTERPHETDRQAGRQAEALHETDRQAGRQTETPHETRHESGQGPGDDAAGTPAAGGAAGATTQEAATARTQAEPPRQTETRCAHCFVTFAVPAELAHHSREHCFPDDPAEEVP